MKEIQNALRRKKYKARVYNYMAGRRIAMIESTALAARIQDLTFPKTGIVGRDNELGL